MRICTVLMILPLVSTFALAQAEVYVENNVVKESTGSAQSSQPAFRSRYRSVNLFNEALEQRRDDMERTRSEYEDALRQYGPDHDTTHAAEKRANEAEKKYLRILEKADRASQQMLKDLRKG